MIKHKIDKVEKDLVLLGAGHANISVMKYIGRIKPKGLRITLITDNLYSTYSGMIPGYIQGEYSWKEINIDVYRLANKFNIRIIHASVTNIIHAQKRVFLDRRPPISYDILSINLGITSKRNNILGADKNTYALKPISKIKQTIDKTMNYFANSNKKENLVIIGGGAAGVEVSLAFNRKFKSLNLNHQIYLISKNKTVVKNFNIRAQKRIKQKLKDNNIILVTGTEIKKITKTYVVIDKDNIIKCKNTILSTSAASPNWTKKTDLPLSKNSFILVDNTLAVFDRSGVFAAGDIADIKNSALPKAGVFAVKQGKILKKNILLHIKNKKLFYYIPQKHFISIIGLSDNKALLNRSNLYVMNNIIWKVKKLIDKIFIRKFNVKSEISVLKNNNSEDPFDFDMQCSGCASKVPHSILAKAFKENVFRGSLDAEAIPYNKNLYHTVDIITNLISDPYKLGIIAAKHAVNDIISANATPISAQMVLSIPPTSPNIASRDIIQIKEGASSYLNKFNCKIMGGHTFTNMSQETAVGFSIVGKQLIKSYNLNLLSGSKILITNKIGSAMVIAGIRRNMIDSNQLIEVEEQMTSNNIEILNIFNKNRINQITDISGFGLLIHLSNLLKRCGKNTGADIFLEKIMIFKGAQEAIKKNIVSSLSNSNKYYMNKYLDIKNKKENLVNIVFDPQTAGGFLFLYNGDHNRIIKEFKNIKVPCALIGYTNKKNKIRVF